MPTDLEDLVSFIHHGNTPIRQLAVENLIPYSTAQPSIFKTNQLLPVRDLQLLVRDYAEIAKNAITILINLSTDPIILSHLASDDKFLSTILSQLSNPTEPNTNLLCMLLANLAKHNSSLRLVTLQIAKPPSPIPTSPTGLSLLLDLFVRGSDGAYNKAANFDYLAYVFADISAHSSAQSYFLNSQTYDSIIPLTKLTVFTEHPSAIRRAGVASTIKNCAFSISSHPSFLSPSAINIMPYLLLPLMGAEEYPDDEMENMLDELQLLPPEKKREVDAKIIKTHVETLMLLTTTREGREDMRQMGVYPIVRECHLALEDEEVREACERLVQVLMGEEDGERKGPKYGMKSLSRNVKPAPLQAVGGSGSWAKIEEVPSDEDEDGDRIIEV